MSGDSIRAYDAQIRVRSYDADMEVMHPNRATMVAIVVDFLPFGRDEAVTILDLGIGTGFLTEQVLLKYPGGRVIGVDGAKAMVAMASVRLRAMADRVNFVVCDFRTLDTLMSESGSVDAVVTSYALHHLDAVEKSAVLGTCVDLLKPGGLFTDADLIVASSPFVESRIQQLRVSGILGRATLEDERFRNEASTRRFLDDLQAQEGDQPLTLAAELDVLREAGLVDVDVLWLEHREAVTFGRKPK